MPENIKTNTSLELLPLKNIMGQMSSFAIILDETGLITSMSDNTLNTLGYSINDILNKSIYEIISAENDQAIEGLVTTTKIHGLEVSFVKKDESKIPVIFSSSIIKNPNSQSLGILCIAQDIHDYKKISHEKNKIQKQIMHMEKMASLGVISAGVAHEINNPLSFVTSNISTTQDYIETIKKLLKICKDLTIVDSYKNGFDQHEILKQLKILTETENIDFMIGDFENILSESKEGVKRIADIVSNLNQFTRKDINDKKDININDCIKSTLKILHNQIKYHAKVITDFDDLPNVNLAPGKINQVFMNIILNAAQAIKKDGIITIKTVFKQNNIIITIQDNGPGVPKEITNKIFDPFFTTKAVGQGTGLGLFISHDIIKDIGGNISLESKKDQGTLFTISIPCHAKNFDCDKNTNANTDGKIATTTSNFNLAGKTILIVDDEDLMRSFMSDVLEEHGAKTFLAKNGLEGLNLYLTHQQKIDLIILDIIMPVMNGIETFNKIAENNKNLPVILCSGYSENQDINELLKYDNVKFIQKPFNATDFLSAVSQPSVANTS